MVRNLVKNFFWFWLAREGKLRQPAIVHYLPGQCAENKTIQLFVVGRSPYTILVFLLGIV